VAAPPQRGEMETVVEWSRNGRTGAPRALAPCRLMQLLQVDSDERLRALCLRCSEMICALDSAGGEGLPPEIIGGLPATTVVLPGWTANAWLILDALANAGVALTHTIAEPPLRDSDDLTPLPEYVVRRRLMTVLKRLLNDPLISWCGRLSSSRDRLGTRRAFRIEACVTYRPRLSRVSAEHVRAGRSQQRGLRHGDCSSAEWLLGLLRRSKCIKLLGSRLTLGVQTAVAPAAQSLVDGERQLLGDARGHGSNVHARERGSASSAPAQGESAS
jgi:hypothetical protein